MKHFQNILKTGLGLRIECSFPIMAESRLLKGDIVNMKIRSKVPAVLLFPLIYIICSNNLAIAQNDLSDPIIGTWELNQSESSQSDNAPLPNWTSRTEVYLFTDDGMMEMNSSTILSDGTSGSGKALWPYNGGITQTGVAGRDNELIIESRISARQWLVTQLLNGVQISSRLKIISDDGNRMVQTFKALDGQNKIYEKHSVFYKQ